MLHSLTSNHTLVDGNKRTGWAAAIVFLHLNEHPLVEPLDEDRAEKFVIATAQSQLELADIAEELRHYVEP